MEQTDLSKDSEFFFSLIIFQVESCLFKVLRKPFVDVSQVFREMFDLPDAEGTVSDGTDEAHPLHLDGISVDEFRAFLKALYAAQHHDPLNLSLEEWTSVLKLARMWAFNELREHAIKRLDSSSMDAVLRIDIAREYEIPNWVRKAYLELVERENTLTDEEVEQLDLYDAFQITRFREQRMEKLVAHFNSGHSRTRRCEMGHTNYTQEIATICKRSKCGHPLKDDITDGCEIFQFDLTDVE